LEKLDSLLDCFIEKNMTLAVAESMTGGGLSERLTSLPNSSKFFLGGIVAYTDSAKIHVLGIPKELLRKYSAVSSHVAKQMAAQVRELMRANYGVGITGIAGPTSPSKHQPLGLVYIALNNEGLEYVHEFHFKGNRETIRTLAIEKTIEILHDAISIK
jgi:PncC family amidohydrolase